MQYNNEQKATRNILKIIEQYKQQHKLTGDINTIKNINQSLDNLEKDKIYHEILIKIKILSYQGFKNIQQLKIPGRNNTYYSGKYITIYMFLLDGYPKQPPQFYFSKVKQKDVPSDDVLYGMEWPFLHLNVEPGTGLLCTMINNQQYQPSLSLAQLILEVQNIIYNPTIQSAYGYGPLFQSYEGSAGGQLYNQQLICQGENLQNIDSE